MKLLQSNRGRGRRGAALLYAVFAAFAAATMVSMMMTLSLSSNRTSVQKRHGGQARYLAEGALEVAKRDVTEAIANWQPVPAAGTVTIDGTPVGYTVQPTGFNTIATEPSGIQSIVTGYEIRATGGVQGHESTVHRLINTVATPIFQYAVFYTGDLEINPPVGLNSVETKDGPKMMLRGRIHTNADLYLNCGGTMTINSNYVRAVGELYRDRKPGLPVYGGDVEIRRWVADPFDPSEPVEFFVTPSQEELAALGVPSVSGYDSRFTEGWDANLDGDFEDPGDWYPWAPGALEYWSQPESYTGGMGYTVMTSDHGVPMASTPFIGSIQMYEPVQGGTHYYDPSVGEYLPAAPGMGTHSKGHYHGLADISIITSAAGTVTVYDQDGTDITATIPGLTSQVKLYDARQANGGTKKLTLTQIDLAALAGKYPQNGLIYAASYDPGLGTRLKGIQLVNGAQLDAPLTIVSENSIYIAGDYNTVGKKGAAVIGDAVNLLSNGWDNTKVKGILPRATETTYNVAMVTGNTETQGGVYSGGLENLPRLHEDWKDVPLNLTGSLVNTWLSQYAIEPWQLGSYYYVPPDSYFVYDLAFNNVASLPPFTPLAVTAEDVAVW